MKTMSKIVRYIYKCRQCNTRFANSDSEIEYLNSNPLVNAIHKITINNQEPLPMITTHICSDISEGIADFIGYEITDH